MNNSFNRFRLILLIVLFGTNVIWAVAYWSQNKVLKDTQNELAAITKNKEILIFLKLFVEKVLKAEGIVDFNTRVELQNAITDIHDEPIRKAWENFLLAKTETEGQTSVRNLLSELIDKAQQ